MRIALVSDVHGNLPALEAVASDIRRRGVDHIVCLGDNVSGPLLPRETAQYLMSSGWTVMAGNHERQVLEFEAGGGGASDAYAHSQLTTAQMQWMRSLQPTSRVFSEAFFCHGTPRSDCEHFLESEVGGTLSLASLADIHDRLGDVGATLVACGHSHVPRSVRLTTGQLIVNPGSVGLQAYTDDHPTHYFVELGTPDAHYAIVEQIGSGWVSSHYAVAYDFESMATLARARSRPEWETALRRGRVR